MNETEFYYIICMFIGSFLGCFLTIGFLFYWNVWKCIFLGHTWAYAEARAKGAITGKSRPLCFRRACTRCGKIQEIGHYSWGPRYIGKDGVEYMQKPVWVTPEDAA